MAIEITQSYVTYQCQTRLLEIAGQVANSRSKTKPAIKAAIQLGTQLRLGLESLSYSRFLTKSQIDEILYILSHIGTINALPFAPVTSSATAPTILVGIPGPIGATGATGLTGGGIAFSSSNVSVDTVVDTFPITLAGAAEWTYEVYNTSNKRVEKLIGTWLSDGSQFVDDGGITLDPEIGTTSTAISFSTNISAGNVQLIAHVLSGTWTVTGTRQLIPVTGNGITQPTSLTDGAIWIGDSSNQPVSQILTGDVTVTNTGVTNITSNCIVNADINGSAAITLTKLATLTASRAVVSDGSGYLTTSATTATQIGYLSGVTSDVQAQIDAIAMSGSITGAITTFVTANASPSLAIVSNPSGKLVVSATTATQIGYLSATTSDIQIQLDSKLALAGGTMSGVIAMGSNKITGLAAATSSGDALRYEQLVGVYLPLAGGTMSGNIAMGGNKVTGLAAASAPGEAVRYEQLSVRTVTNGVSRSFNTPFQPSLTKDCFVNYSLFVASGSGKTSTVSLQTSPDNAIYTEIARFGNDNNTGGIGTFEEDWGQLSSYVPAGYYVNLLPAGAGTKTYITGQEITL